MRIVSGVGSESLREEVEAVTARLARVQAAASTLGSLVRDNGEHLARRDLSVAVRALQADLSVLELAVARVARVADESLS
jgi:hypothetical protein